MALSRGAAGGSRTVPWGPNLKENGASLYGRDPTKGFADAVAWPVAVGSARWSMRNVRSRRPGVDWRKFAPLPAGA